MIEAKVVADSIGPSKVRLTTFVLTYPRFIHSEFMTHRMLSRNAASSRAIPLKKTRKAVWSAPAMPVAFSKNKAGMQASEDLSPLKALAARALWVATGRAVTIVAWMFEKLGVHKQHANRILEPWLHMTVVATATEWDNFFGLRFHPMAQPEFQELAKQMWKVYCESLPRKLNAGEWHLPFVSKDEVEMEKLQNSVEPRSGVPGYIRKSVARCARVSYLNHDGKKSSFLEDFELYTKLLKSQPIHASPAEHQAMARESENYSGNLRGWTQFRKTLHGESISNFEPGMFDDKC